MPRFQNARQNAHKNRRASGRRQSVPNAALTKSFRLSIRAITPALQHSIDTGHAILADREEWEGMTEWYCKSCGCDWSRHSRRFKKTGGVNATKG